MSNQLTPMQEAIEKVKEYKENHFTHSKKNSEKQIVVDTILQVILNDLTELLPKERQVIEDACIFGFKNPELYETHYQKAKDYYNTKFKQNGR